MKRIACALFLLAGIISISGTSAADTGQSPSDECDITTSSAAGETLCPTDQFTAVQCPINPNLSINAQNCQGNGSSWQGVRTDKANGAPSLAATPIDSWYYCRYVDNYSASNSYFVPFNTLKEWLAFIDNLPAGIQLVTCARPGQLQVPDDYAVPFTPAAFYDPSLTCDTQQSSPAVSLPYGRTNSTYPPTPVAEQFTCNVAGLCDIDDPTNCGANQQWIQTASATFLAGTAPDNANTPPSGAWSFGNIQYSGSKPSPNPPPNYCSLGSDYYETPSCGPANGVAVTSAPSSGLCTHGTTPFGVSGSGPWNWECDDVVGAAIACSVPCSAPQAAVCAAADYARNGSWIGTCASGTSTVPNWSYAEPVQWQCLGGGGTVANCSDAPAPTDGVCGGANGAPDLNAPWADGSNLCSYGNAVNGTSDGNNWYWDCQGINSGNTANCSSPREQAGQCGGSLDSCAVGSYAGNQWSDGTNYHWTCNGINGGPGTGWCSAPVPYDCPAQCFYSSWTDSYVCEPASNAGVQTGRIMSYCQQFSNYECNQSGYDNYTCEAGAGWVDFDSAGCYCTAISVDGGSE